MQIDGCRESHDIVLFHVESEDFVWVNKSVMYFLAYNDMFLLSMLSQQTMKLQKYKLVFNISYNTLSEDEIFFHLVLNWFAGNTIYIYIYTNLIWTPLIKVSLIFSILIMTLVLCSYRGLECLNQKKIYNILKMMIYPNCFWQLILIGFWTIRGLNFHLLFFENMKGCFPFKKECLIIGCDILVLLREDDFDLSQPPKL